MFYVRCLYQVLSPFSKLSQNLKQMAKVHRKCACSNDNKHNLYSTASQMEQKFKILSNPVKSASDEKEYK